MNTTAQTPPARPLRALWRRLTEPTLVRRSVASVVLAFVMVWAVLLGYIFFTYKQTIANEPSLQKYGDALLVSLQGLSDPTHAAAVLGSTDIWTNIRRRQIGLLPGTALHELRDAMGQLVFASPGLQRLALPPSTPEAVGVITEATAGGTVYRIYTGHNARWALRVIEPKRADSAVLAYNGRFILPYLLLALPFVLLPVWLSVRNGLQPLQQLASRIAQRNTDELQPVGFNARHRELKPLEQSLDHLFARLRQKVERERAFVQDAAHEIRTPLAVISAQVHVMARSPSKHERIQAQAHMEEAIARTSHLAQQLLDLAALDEAQRPSPRATWTWRSGCALPWRTPRPRPWRGASNSRWMPPTACRRGWTCLRWSPSHTTSSTTQCATCRRAATCPLRCGRTEASSTWRFRTTDPALLSPNTSASSSASTVALATPPMARAWAWPSCGKRPCAWVVRYRWAMGWVGRAARGLVFS